MPVFLRGSFKQEFSQQKREMEARRIRQKYPDRVPVIVEQARKQDFSDIDMKRKYLVPGELTMGQFVYVVRKRLKLNAEKAIFLSTESGVMPPTTQLMGTIDVEHRDKDDNFLYLMYSAENTFGSG